MRHCRNILDESRQFESIIPGIHSNPFTLIIKSTIGTFLVSLVVTLVISFFNFLLTSFYISNTIMILKFCLGLIFWTLVSMIPLLGIYFIFKLPFYSIQIIEILHIPIEINVIISFLLFFLLATIIFTFNTYVLIILLKKYFFGPSVKVENKKMTEITLIISIIIGLIFIFISDFLFFPIYQIIISI